MIEFRAEQPEDAAPIETLLDTAFGPERQRKISYGFRTDVAPIDALCMTAHTEGRLVGTIRYWPIMIGQAPALLLGPVAVGAAWRKLRVGDRLVRSSMAVAASTGHRSVLLVGDMSYYSRFGFAEAGSHGIVMPREAPARVLVCSLDHAAPIPQGIVQAARYPRGLRLAA